MYKYYNVRIKVEAENIKKCDETAKTLVEQSNKCVKLANGIQIGEGKTTSYELVEEKKEIVSRTANADLMLLLGLIGGLLRQLFF